jgi:hypothetical protein
MRTLKVHEEVLSLLLKVANSAVLQNSKTWHMQFWCLLPNWFHLCFWGMVCAFPILIKLIYRGATMLIEAFNET